jgi:cytochrome c oxidase cbb3-type subunit III
MSDNNNEKNQIFKDEEALLLSHEYDGIQELDHPLPSWWLWIFYVTIIFSVFYVGYYMTGIGPTLKEELDVAMAEIEAKRASKVATSEPSDLETVILASLQSPDKLKSGNAVYTGKCAACHGDVGQGLIGPNLTDDYWVHGGTLSEIAAIIRDGVAEKGMPPWGAILSEDELYDVTAYIRSLRGSNPPNAKESEGIKFDL